MKIFPKTEENNSLCTFGIADLQIKQVPIFNSVEYIQWRKGQRNIKANTNTIFRQCAKYLGIAK